MAALIWFLSSRLSASLRTDVFARITARASVMSVALGTFALIMSVSILTGYEERIQEAALKFTSHVEVRPQHISQHDLARLLTSIHELNGVESTRMMFVREALIRSRNDVDGVVVHGVDPSSLQETFSGIVTEGTLPTSSDDCVIGADIARKLSLRTGDTALFYAEQHQSDGELTPVMFISRISGIVTSGMGMIDGSLVVMDKGELARVMGSDSLASAVITVTLADPNRADLLAIRLRTLYPDNAQVTTWKERFAGIAGWIELQKQPIPIVLALISLVAVFTLISSIVVSVVLKSRSLAILSTLGLKLHEIMAVMFVRGLRLGCTGGLLGASLAWILVFIQHTWAPVSLDSSIYYVSTLPVSLSPLPFLIITLGVILLSVIASCLPLIAIKRLRISQILRFS